MSPDNRASPPMTTEEIQHQYNAFAPWYDVVEGLPELLGVRHLRRALLQRASGTTLEVAVGTGKSLRYYPPSCQLTAVDVSVAMLRIARQRAARLGLCATFHVMDAEHLAFPDQYFDTVVDTLALCTFPDPLAVLREMARTCKPEGRLLLLEHGRSDRDWLGKRQDRWAERHAKKLGCWWNREPLALVQQAGLRVIAARRTFFGIFHVMEARPAGTARAAHCEYAATRMSGHNGGSHAP
jgi:ubiquinone/menaquinone biosynthesis C-methylase UbiE